MVRLTFNVHCGHVILQYTTFLSEDDPRGFRFVQLYFKAMYNIFSFPFQQPEKHDYIFIWNRFEGLSILLVSISSTNSHIIKRLVRKAGKQNMICRWIFPPICCLPEVLKYNFCYSLLTYLCWLEITDAAMSGRQQLGETGTRAGEQGLKHFFPQP